MRWERINRRTYSLRAADAGGMLLAEVTHSCGYWLWRARSVPESRAWAAVGSQGHRHLACRSAVEALRVGGVIPAGVAVEVSP